MSSPTIKNKAVQIRPWRLADADYVLDASMPLDPRKTVFVGGVPRPLKACEYFGGRVAPRLGEMFILESCCRRAGHHHGPAVRWGLLRRNRHRSGAEVPEGKRFFTVECVVQIKECAHLLLHRAPAALRSPTSRATSRPSRLGLCSCSTATLTSASR